MSRDRYLRLADDGDDGEPGDPDFMLITDYLAKDLSPEQMEAVERRLADDEGFFEKVWPIVRIWDLPRYARQRRERARRKAQGLVPRRHQSPAAPPLAIVPRRPLRALRVAQRWAGLSPKTRSWIGTAAGLAIVAGSVYAGFARHGSGIVSPAFAAERASVADIPDSVQVETGRGETRVMVLAGGSRLVMRANSRITYHRVPGMVPVISYAAFDGEMALELHAGSLLIRTSSGGTLFTPGTYALRCEPGCKAMLVTAGVGQALLRGETKSLGSVVLHAGEKGRVPRHGRPEKVSPGARGWPSPEPRRGG